MTLTRMRFDGILRCAQDDNQRRVSEEIGNQQSKINNLQSLDFLPVLLRRFYHHAFEVGKADVFAALAAVVRRLGMIVSMAVGGIVCVIVDTLAALELMLQAGHL